MNYSYHLENSLLFELFFSVEICFLEVEFTTYLNAHQRTKNNKIISIMKVVNNSHVISDAKNTANQEKIRETLDFDPYGEYF